MVKYKENSGSFKKGYRMTEEHRGRIITSLIGNKRNSGKKRSEEARIKIMCIIL